MNRTTLGALAAGILMGGGAMYSVTAQQDGQHHEMDMEVMMQAWMEAGMPGPEHKEMAMGVGMFDAHGTNYMPDGSTSHWTGTVERNAIFDGRFVLEHYKVDDMPGFGGFEGYGVTGFNNVTRQYETTWIDSLSTMIFMAKGEKDPSTGKLIMTGMRADPMTGGEMKSKSVTTINDDGSFVLDMYAITPEGEWQEMSIHHSPKKDMGKHKGEGKGESKKDEHAGHNH